MKDDHIEAIIARYVKDRDTVSIGSNELGERFVKKLALALEMKHIPITEIDFIPTSFRIASLASQVGLKIADINDHEVDVAIEFVDQIDSHYNFVKRSSASFVRDKMIAQSAGLLVAIAEDKAYVKKIRGNIPYEVATFGWKRTLNQLDSFGKAKQRLRKDGMPEKTETGNYIIDVEFDRLFNYEELELTTKNIPGVLESGLFVGYADKIMLHGKNIRLMSRTE
ncbi:Ribose-5-phosphate isomerase A [uncultured archaeon]|nr:Ribose-5-phosphate isomerase A [uncultured archaeon]